MLKLFSLILILNSFAVFSESRFRNFEEFKTHHKNLVMVVMELEKTNAYYKKNPIEGEYSLNIPFEQKLLENLLSLSYANDTVQFCFFGGWPSYMERGYCRVPWNYSMESRFGISYNRDHYCRHPDMFRCNPVLFGPGDGQVAQESNGAGLSAGACVNYKSNGNSIGDVTKLCYERSKDNIEEIYNLYQQDENFRNRYHLMVEETTRFCQYKPSYSACEYLMDRITAVNVKICENENAQPMEDATVEELQRVQGELAAAVGTDGESSELAPEASLRPRPRPEVADIPAEREGVPLTGDGQQYNITSEQERHALIDQIIAAGPEQLGTTIMTMPDGKQYEVMNDNITLPDGTYVPLTFPEAQRIAQAWGYQLPSAEQAIEIGRVAAANGDQFRAIPRSPNNNRQSQLQSMNEMMNDPRMRERAVQGRTELIDGHFKWYTNDGKIYGFARGDGRFWQNTPSGAHTANADYYDYSHGVRLIRPAGSTNEERSSSLAITQRERTEDIDPIRVQTRERVPNEAHTYRHTPAATSGEVADEAVVAVPTPRPASQTETEHCQVEGTSEQWRKNCEQLYAQGIPAGALNYALRVMQLNSTSFRSNKCFRPHPNRENGGLKPSWHTSMQGLTDDQFENNLMGNGLANKCQIVINDAGDRVNSDCRARMYYIDLCQGSSPVVKRDYFNMGTGGSCRGGRNGNTNGVGLNTTVLGAFFTHNQTFDFRDTTTQRSAYDRVASDVQAAGGPRQATSVQLFGLQNSNNLASVTGKYMHVTNWQSSHGCPSISPQNYYMIEALAANGPSLVLNYHEGRMDDINECTE